MLNALNRALKERQFRASCCGAVSSHYIGPKLALLIKGEDFEGNYTALKVSTLGG
jgi:hypothetical protein